MEWGVHVLRPLSRAEAASLRDAGPLRATVHLPWRWMEPRPGAWETASVDHLLAPLRAAGVPLQGVLGPGMPHLLPDAVLRGGGADSDGYIACFATYCAETARRLTDVTVFRVEDELNAAWPWEVLGTRRRRGKRWRDAEFRRELRRAALEALTAARPDADLRVTLHAAAPGWRREARELRLAASSSERGALGSPGIARLGLTLAPCNHFPLPELARLVGDAVAAAREATGDRLPVEVSRSGFPTQRPAFSPRRQREYLQVAAESVERAGAVGFHWWALRDQAHDDPVLGYWTPERERFMGLWHYDGTPKPAWDELCVLARGSRFGQARGT
jgi:hypothetical protein